MGRPTRIRAPLAALVCGLAALLAVLAAGCGNAQPARATGTATVTVSATQVGPPVPFGFLGISMEYRGLEAYAGSSARALDQPFLQLLRNLAPDGGFVLRIGGDSTDWTWWPMPHTVRPGGVRYDLGPNWAAVARTVAAAIGARMILGVNFEADSRSIAAYEARALIQHVGSSVEAVELGNEPELYGAFPWYRTRSGQHVPGRPRSWDLPMMISDFARVSAGLPSIRIAGPSSGGPEYLRGLRGFVDREPRLGMVTVHAYPLKHCNPHIFDAPSEFFTHAALQGLADMIRGWTRIAAGRRLPLRIDEMNSISCGGQKGLSQSFAPALWTLDMLPRIVRTGAAGVNFHTVPATNQALLTATHGRGGWSVAVEPEYYGLLAFSQAAPAGSRLLRLSGPGGGVDAWAARSPGGQVHVVLINPGRSARQLELSVAGGTGAATVARLQAPSLGATSGVTLAGMRIGAATGTLSGTPATSTVQPGSGGYGVSLPAHSAAIVSLRAS